MNKLTHISIRNQARKLKKAPWYVRKALKLLEKIKSSLAETFRIDPLAHCMDYTDSELKILRYFINFASNPRVMWFSQQHIADVCGVSIVTVERTLSQLRQDGLIISVRPTWYSTCLYRLSSALYTQRVCQALKSLFPVLACVFSLSMLASSSVQLENEGLLQGPGFNKDIVGSSRVIRARESEQFFPKTEIVGDRRAGAMPELRPDEMAWLRSSSYHEKLHLQHKKDHPVEKDPFIEVYKQRAWRRLLLAALVNSEVISEGEKPGEVEIMSKMRDISSEQREKLQKEAMHKLIPDVIKNFKAIPLSIAGKIYLSRFPERAIKASIKLINNSLPPNTAFKHFVGVCYDYCNDNNLSRNMDAYNFLMDLYGIPAGAPYACRPQNRPELKIWKDTMLEREEEAIHISYFKVEESYKKTGNPLNLPNFYEKVFQALVQEAVDSTGISPEHLKEELYALYLAQKEKNEDVRPPGEANTATEAKNLDIRDGTSIRPTETGQGRIAHTAPPSARIL